VNKIETDIFAKVVLAKRVICFPVIDRYFSPALQVIWDKVREVFPVSDEK